MIYRFLKRHYLTLRRGMHIGQSLPSESYDRIMSYLKEIIRIRLYKNINELYLILNADETTCLFQYANCQSCRKKIGKKTVTISTQGQEKLRVSCLLTVSASGGQIASFYCF